MTETLQNPGIPRPEMNQPPPVPPTVTIIRERKSDRPLLWFILGLQILIIGWLAKHQFDGACFLTSLQPGATSATVETPSSPGHLSDIAPSSFPSVKAPVFLPSPASSHLIQRLAPRRPSPSAEARLHSQMNRMITDAQRIFAAGINPFLDTDPTWAQLPPSPVMDIRQFDDRYELTLSMPDLTPEDVEYRLDGRLLYLTIRHTDSDSDHAARQQHMARILFQGPAPDPQAVQLSTAAEGQLLLTFPKRTESAVETSS